MKLPPNMKEITLNVLAFFWLLFVLTNANTNLGNAYLWFLVISTVLLFINMFIFDKGTKVTYQKRPGGHIEAFFAGAVSWVILLLASYIILKVVDPIKASFGSIMASFGAANPVFSNSQIVNWVTISFAIGYAETQLWARLLEFLADKFNINIDRRSKTLIGFLVLVVILATLFMVFHLTSKGVNAVSSLVIVFIMMALSLFLVAYYDGETRQAVWLHIIANGAAGFLMLLSGSSLLT
jgi:hypothetical protein